MILHWIIHLTAGMLQTLLLVVISKLCTCFCLPAQVIAAGGRGSLTAAAPVGVSRDEDGGRYYSTKRGAFHEVFNLPESERPLTGEKGTTRENELIDESFQLSLKCWPIILCGSYNMQ